MHYQVDDNVAEERGFELLSFLELFGPLYGADLAGAYLDGTQFLNCAQLIVTRNWQSAFRE